MITGARIIELRKGIGLTQGDFGNRLQYSQIQISRYEKDNLEIPIDFIQKLHTEFRVDVNKLIASDAVWNAYLIAYLNAYPSIEGETFIVADTSESYAVRPNTSMIPAIVTVDEGGNDNIIAVDVKAAAGYVQHFQDKRYFKQLPAFKLFGSRFRNGTFRAFEVEGESMSDTIMPGQWVIARHLNSLSEIKEGYCHVVVCTDGLVVKRVLNRVDSRKKLVLLSDNEVFRPYEVDIEEVKELWIIIAALGFDLTSKRGGLQHQLNSLTEKFIALESRINKAGL